MPSTPESKGGAAPGTLYVVATPIGNLADVTLRALETLRSVDCVAAEDTRHSRKLLTHYDIHVPLVSYHSHNAQSRGPELIARLRAGQSLAVVTDAGTPGISDPGGLLVHQALEAELPVVVVPGPAALLAALVASGLPTHPFAFLGFAPSRGSGRRKFFETYAALPMTVILYESPQRLLRTLEELRATWGDRRVAVARELTKKHEEIFRGRIVEAMAHFAEAVRGELTLVIEGAGEAVSPDPQDWKQVLSECLQAGAMSVREATDRVSKQFGVSRKLVYREALAMKK